MIVRTMMRVMIMFMHHVFLQGLTARKRSSPVATASIGPRFDNTTEAF